MAYQTYYDGDFWYCKAATSVGQSPATHPAKFERIEHRGRTPRVDEPEQDEYADPHQRAHRHDP